MIESVALGFAWQDKHSGHSKVLFHLVWSAYLSHYYLNAGAYDYEEEVILQDGTFADVVSVKAIKDSNDQVLYTLIKLERKFT